MNSFKLILLRLHYLRAFGFPISSDIIIYSFSDDGFFSLCLILRAISVAAVSSFFKCFSKAAACFSIFGLIVFFCFPIAVLFLSQVLTNVCSEAVFLWKLSSGTGIKPGFSFG